MSAIPKLKSDSALPINLTNIMTESYIQAFHFCTVCKLPICVQDPAASYIQTDLS